MRRCRRSDCAGCIGARRPLRFEPHGSGRDLDDGGGPATALAAKRESDRTVPDDRGQCGKGFVDGMTQRVGAGASRNVFHGCVPGDDDTTVIDHYDRHFRLALTETGHTAVTDAYQAHNAREQAWAASLTPSEQTVLIGLLEKLTTSPAAAAAQRLA